MEVKSIDSSMEIGLLSFAGIPLMYLIMNVYLKFADKMPSKKDWHRKEYFSLSSDKISRLTFEVFKSSSRFFSSIACRYSTIRPILRRQWLYILRYDFFKNIVLLLILIAGAFIFNFIGAPEICIAIQMFSSIAVLFFWTSSLDKANESKTQCNYYYFEEKEQAFASIFLLLPIIGPFLIATIVTLANSDQNKLLLFINVIVLYSATGLAYSIRWNEKRWDNKSKAKLVLMCLFVYSSLAFAKNKQLQISLLIGLTYALIEIVDFFRYFRLLNKIFRYPKKIAIITGGVCLAAFSIYWLFNIFVEPIQRSKFINTASERPAVLSVNCFSADDSLCSISREYKGYWNLNYDKNIEPKPWIIKDSTISIYDEDNGTRTIMSAKMFKIGNERFINCHALTGTFKNKNQYVMAIDLPVNALLKMNINENGILNIYALNPFVLVKLLKNDSLCAKYTRKRDTFIFVYSTDEWQSVLRKYAGHDDLFALMGSFTPKK
jgi:hypothetical protein